MNKLKVDSELLVASLQQENERLKDQLKHTTHCYDESEHKRLEEELNKYKKILIETQCNFRNIKLLLKSVKNEIESVIIDTDTNNYILNRILKGNDDLKHKYNAKSIEKRFEYARRSYKKSISLIDTLLYQIEVLEKGKNRFYWFKSRNMKKDVKKGEYERVNKTNDNFL